jgi:pimeloyl-ACP methyl ester carboxylesterase
MLPRLRSRLALPLLVAPLLAGALVACGPPPDRGLTRPVAVPATPYTQRDLIVAGVRLRYVDEGPRDAPVVLVLPGHTTRIEDYDDLVPAFVPHFRVLLPDLPGKGYSDKPVRRYDFAYYEETAAGFLDALGVSRADVVGGSLGANLALRLAHRYPERFRRVAGWAPGSAMPPHPWLAKVAEWAGGSYPVVRAALRIQSRYWYSDGFPGREEALREKFAHYDEVMGPGFAAMYSGMAADSLRTSLYDLAPEIDQPVLLLVGELDVAADIHSGVRRLGELLPNAEVHEIPGAGHSLLAEAPAELTSRIARFLGDGPQLKSN